MKKGTAAAVQRFLCILLTIALTAGGVRVLSAAVRDRESEIKYRPFTEETADIDVLFFGSSHTRYGILPMQLWNEYGIVSYNMGNSGLGIASSYWTLELALRYQRPRYAVLDVFGIGTTAQQALGLVHEAFDFFPTDKVKMAAAADLYQDPAKRAELLFPYIVYHNKWSGITAASFAPVAEDELNLEKGASRMTEWMEPEKMPLTGEDDVLDLTDPPDGVVYLHRFIDTCRENGVTPVLIFVPFEAQPERQREANTARVIAAEEGIAFLDLFREGVIDPMIDSADLNSHLNPAGAAKVTARLGAFLSGELGVPDRRDDPACAHWHEAYARYRADALIPDLVGEEDLRALLSELYEQSFGAYITTFHGTVLLPEEEKLLAQIPYLYGRSEEEEDPEHPETDIRVFLYDRETGGELAVRDFAVSRTALARD